MHSLRPACLLLAAALAACAASPPANNAPTAAPSPEVHITAPPDPTPSSPPAAPPAAPPVATAPLLPDRAPAQRPEDGAFDPSSAPDDDFVAYGGVIGGAVVSAPAPASASAVSPAPADSRPTLVDNKLDCPFPSGPGTDEIDIATVSLVADIAADGSIKSVSVTRDPGSGFGAAARKCVLAKGKFRPARDASGAAIPGVTKPIFIRFVR